MKQKCFLQLQTRLQIKKYKVSRTSSPGNREKAPTPASQKAEKEKAVASPRKTIIAKSALREEVAQPTSHTSRSGTPQRRSAPKDTCREAGATAAQYALSQAASDTARMRSSKTPHIVPKANIPKKRTQNTEFLHFFSADTALSSVQSDASEAALRNPAPDYFYQWHIFEAGLIYRKFLENSRKKRKSRNFCKLCRNIMLTALCQLVNNCIALRQPFIHHSLHLVGRHRYLSQIFDLQVILQNLIL